MCYRRPFFIAFSVDGGMGPGCACHPELTGLVAGYLEEQHCFYGDPDPLSKSFWI
jgi:hypothetical protein